MTHGIDRAATAPDGNVRAPARDLVERQEQLGHLHRMLFIRAERCRAHAQLFRALGQGHEIHERVAAIEMVGYPHA